MSTKEEGAPPNFELRKYELDRTHELELNKFAHALDVERLKVLQLINGGAFTVLVGFSAPLLQAGDPKRWALAAGLCWASGLGAAAWAAQELRQVQADQNKSNRFRRNAVEWRRLSKGLSIAELNARIGPPETGLSASGHQDYDEWAAKAYRDATNSAAVVKWLARAGILLFVLGAMLLTGSIMASESPPPEASVIVTG